MMVNPPPLHGAVLAGGRSRRMGRSKSGLSWDGESFLARSLRLLDEVCERTWVSLGADVPERELGMDYPTFRDPLPDGGPLMGIRGAQVTRPDAAWLVIAVDMPLLDRTTIRALVSARDARYDATAFGDPESGSPEPLCTIWEPSSASLVATDVLAGRLSVVGCLCGLRLKLVEPPDPDSLINTNTPRDLDLVRSIS